MNAKTLQSDILKHYNTYKAAYDNRYNEENMHKALVSFVNEFVHFFDFALDFDSEKDVFKLVDLQGANLGGIEFEEFYTLTEVVNRFRGSVYEADYIDCTNEDLWQNEDYSLDYCTVYYDCFMRSEHVNDILDTIDVNRYKAVEPKQDDALVMAVVFGLHNRNQDNTKKLVGFVTEYVNQ